MYLTLSSPTAIRLLAAVKSGESLKKSARMAGVGRGSLYRLLRDRYLQLRRSGLDSAAAVAEMGIRTGYIPEWEALVDHPRLRHHLAVPEAIEALFWDAFDSGVTVTAASHAAGVSRATGQRWIQRRFDLLRADRVSVAECARRLRLSAGRAERHEHQWQAGLRARQGEAATARRIALATAARHVEQATALHGKLRRRQELTERYWQLIREGAGNTEACRILGMSRRAGGEIRKHAQDRIPTPRGLQGAPGRYLELRERVMIADLRRLGFSLRKIAEHLGRSPSTISRELRRHATTDGNYLPATADHAAHLQRARPKTPKLAANKQLRQLVQRKLNRCWSPEEISGWLRNAYPADKGMRICHETIYRALLTREDTGLHKRYASNLRTGRRIRKNRWRHNHVTGGSRIRNMMMIHERPADVDDKVVPGHWEGDLILGAGCVSAMITLRERVTQYGIVINLPRDHTSATVNAEITRAFRRLPNHLKRTLTWDQGVEMAGHAELTHATGVPVFFAERSSPWQRGANENFNGLLRQYFPKGTDLSQHSSKRVAQVMNELDTRPRKKLDYDTPAARFNAARTLATQAR